MARFNPNGSLDTVSPNPDAPTSTALARYNSNGTLDTTFGVGGKVSVISIGAVNALAVLAGIAQFLSNGTLVPVTSGTIAVTSHTGVTGFQPDSKFILAGGAPGPSGENDLDVKVSRFLPMGGMDPAFFSSPTFDFGAPGLSPTARRRLRSPRTGGSPWAVSRRPRPSGISSVWRGSIPMEHSIPRSATVAG